MNKDCEYENTDESVSALTPVKKGARRKPTNKTINMQPVEPKTVTTTKQTDSVPEKKVVDTIIVWL